MELEDLLAEYPDPSSPPIVSKNFRTRIAAAARWAIEQSEGDLLEIGAYEGQTTVILAQIAEDCGRRVLVVDPWKPGTQNCKGHEYDEFLKRTEPFDNVDAMRLDSRSEEARKCIGKRKLCFALVDGLHTYEAARSDIKACSQAFVIAVDDTNWNVGVRQAYKEARGRRVRCAGRESYLVKGESMELKPLALDEIVGKLRDKDPFALVRYGDGEWLAVLGKTPPHWWGVNEHEPDLPGLGKALRKALKNHPTKDVYLGLVAVNHTKRMGLMPEVEEWLADNAPGLEWYTGDVFLQASEVGKLWPFIEVLEELDTVLVGGPHLEPMADMLGAQFVEIPAHNCWEAHDETLKALKGINCDAMLFSAAMMSEVLIPELWDGTTMLIDVGALWDPFVGKNARSWHARARRNMIENLGGEKIASRAVVILSLPRSGSSAIAGALHRMGIDMGEGHLQLPDQANLHGYYEDVRWSIIHQAVTGTHYVIREPAGLPQRHQRSYGRVLRTCAQKPLWGMKSPRLCFVLHLILPMLESASDVRLVHVRRDWRANVASLKQHSEAAYRGRFKMTDDEAEALLSEWEVALERRLEGFGGPVFEVDYDDLVGDPVGVLTELEAFCFEGIKRLSAGIEEAVAWIDPLLRHEYEDTELAATVDATNKAFELALEAGVDLTRIVGTGQDGRLLIGDVRRYLESREDTDSDPEPDASSGNSAEGSGNGGNPERRD